jgi:hypothetical protein
MLHMPPIYVFNVKKCYLWSSDLSIGFFREKSVMVKCFNDQKPFIHRAYMRTLYHNLRILSEDVKYVWHSIYKKPDHVWKSLTGGHVKCVPMLNTFIKVYMPWDIRLRSFVVAISIISILLCSRFITLALIGITMARIFYH